MGKILKGGRVMKAIASVDERWAIGYRGKLLRPISADLRRFKAITTGHQVILGRKTLESFPGGKPLPGRENLILSATMTEAPEGAKVFSSLSALLDYAKPDAIVIGGESVYRALLPRCDEVYITKISAAFPADSWFPNLDRDPAWQVVDREGPYQDDDIEFSYFTYCWRDIS